MRQILSFLMLNLTLVSLSHAQSIGVWTSSDESTFRAVVGQVDDVCAQNQKSTLDALEQQCAAPTKTPHLTPQACQIVSKLIRDCTCNQSNPACTKVCFDACDFSSCGNPLIQAYCIDNCIPDMVTLCSAR